MPDIENKPDITFALRSSLATLKLTEKYLLDRNIDNEKVSGVGRTQILPAIRESIKLVEACVRRCK
jgi:hypothetical protein